MHTTNSYDQEQSRSNCISLTLPHLIDKIAEHTPNRVFISLPITHNPADGYRDYTYQDFARAIDRCAWWISATIKENADFETLAYIGTQDFRCMILIVAVIKTGHKVRGQFVCVSSNKLTSLPVPRLLPGPNRGLLPPPHTSFPLQSPALLSANPPSCATDSRPR